MRVYPSLLCARQDCIRDEIHATQGADGYHIDVMDGHFVPHLALGPHLVQALKAYTSVPLDVHLMVHDAERIMALFPEADHMTLHLESGNLDDVQACLHKIRRQGKRAGIALNPETSASVLDPLWPDVDQILVMTVPPGRGGQTFQEDQIPKIRDIHRVIQNLEHPIHLMVDGGINQDTAHKAAQAGADTLVVGSYLFNHPTHAYAHIIQDLQSITGGI